MQQLSSPRIESGNEDMQQLSSPWIEAGNISMAYLNVTYKFRHHHIAT